MSEQFVEGSASEWVPTVIKAKKRLTVRVISQIVANYYRVRYEELTSDRRYRPIVRYRQMAMLLAKLNTKASFPEVGRIIGGRDHTTVMHAVKMMPIYMREEPSLAADYDALTRLIDEFSTVETVVSIRDGA